MKVLKKIGALTTAKIAGLFGLVLGVLSVLLSKIACSVNLEAASVYGIQCSSLTWGGSLLVILMSAIVYFITGLVAVALYNVFATWIGGIKVELDEQKSLARKSKKSKK